MSDNRPIEEVWPVGTKVKCIADGSNGKVGECGEVTANYQQRPRPIDAAQGIFQVKWESGRVSSYWRDGRTTKPPAKVYVERVDAQTVTAPEDSVWFSGDSGWRA